MMEVLYGRDFTTEELSRQPIREIAVQSLVLDDEIEKEHIRQAEMDSKNKSGGGGLILGTKNVHDIIFKMKNPDEAEAIVTLLTTEEYKEIEPKNID